MFPRATPLARPLARLTLGPVATALATLSSRAAPPSAARHLLPKPKAAPTAYHFWYKDCRNPSSGRAGLSRSEAGPIWRSLPASERAPYDAAAAAAREQHDAQYTAWYASLTPQMMEAYEALTGSPVHPPGGGAKRRKAELKAREGNPGMPSGAFLMFQEDMKKQGRLNVEEIEDKMQMSRNMASEASKLWDVLDEETKEKYRSEASAIKAKYDAWARTQPDLVAQHEREQHDLAAKKLRRKRLELMRGAPSPPTSAWTNFCDAVRQRGGVPVPPDVVGAAVAQYKSRKMGEMWKKMDEEQRLPYVLKYQNDKRVWAAWEEMHSEV